MRTILVFNDNSPEAENAAEFALDIAQKMKADILVLNLCAYARIENRKIVTAGKQASEEDAGSFSLVTHLYDATCNTEFRPVVNDMDANDLTEKDICELVIRKNIWLMVKGTETNTSHSLPTNTDVQSVLNHVACPLLLVPGNYKKRGFENITYTVDMRYCRTTVLKFLAELARQYDANLVVEHFSAKGLPPLGDDYAASLFKEEIMNKISYDKIYFNNIKERDLEVAVDVMISSLHADLLALVNHRFHFEELFGLSIHNVLPEHILVPAIIFPL